MTGDEHYAFDRLAKDRERLRAVIARLLDACKSAEEYIRIICPPVPPHPWQRQQLCAAIAEAEREVSK